MRKPKREIATGDTVRTIRRVQTYVAGGGSVILAKGMIGVAVSGWNVGGNLYPRVRFWSDLDALVLVDETEVEIVRCE